MVFTPGGWVRKLPQDPPDSIPISEFMLNELYGRHPLGYSKAPFTCGLSGLEYSALEVKERVEYLARGLAKELGWQPNQRSEWDKVVGVFSVNTIDIITLEWAVHSMSGIVSPANSAYSAEELTHQLKDAGAKVLFTCAPLIPLALKAAADAGIPKNRIYLFKIPDQMMAGQSVPKEYKTVDQLIEEGSKEPRLEKLKWTQGQGAKQAAYLCYSSGTSGLPKGVMISHRNVIANCLQIKTYEAPWRESLKDGVTDQTEYTDVALGLLPQNHIYSLVVICHATTYRGDQVIILPKFDMTWYLESIARFKINSLYVVPPIIIMMAKGKAICDKFDLSSVKQIFTGAAPLGGETADDLQKQYPRWMIRQGYGLTETCTVVCSTATHDIWFGSSGCLLPGYEAKLLTPKGKEITEYGKPGELVVRSPSIVLGYLNNEKANKETFDNGWMRTGDEAMIQKSANGNEHVWITDRIKELIKVKGLQVAPAELEAHLLTHPAVADCTVIPVPDEMAGEVPKAYVVKSSSVSLEDSDRMLVRDIQKHVEKHKARHKWLKGGVEFIDAIPKSPSGKILRRLLKDKEKEERRKAGAKL